MTTSTSRFSTKSLLVVAGASALLTGVAAMMLVNIYERKEEGRSTAMRMVELTDETDDPAVWGQNFPFQYDGYRRTVDQSRTRFGGSEALSHSPTQADPRSFVSQSKLEEDGRLKRMWAGYAFSKDFREERGHAFMYLDQLYTERTTTVKQPGTCINCHGSTYVAMKKLGNGDLKAGFEAINKLRYDEAKKHVTHAVACIDCHDPQTMALRVTRPAFMEGIALVKAKEGIANYDVNKMATRQEMRSYVCGQCHVEYHFAGPEKRLTFPWKNGLRGDEILSYYDEIGFKDWVHKETGAPALKAQHPEFEAWSQGIHAQNGVSCADCHMPYQRIGATKVSDHHVRSPLLNLQAACQTCHRAGDEELRARVELIQTRHFELRNHAMDGLMQLLDEIKAAKDSGAKEEELADVLKSQRSATFLLDFAEAENSTGFHADQEGARILGLSLDHLRNAEVQLAAYWKSKANGGAPTAAPASNGTNNDSSAGQPAAAQPAGAQPSAAPDTTPPPGAAGTPTAPASPGTHP